MAALSDELQSDFRRAALESKATDVGSTVAGVAGGIGAIAGVLGKVHPILGIGGFVIALAAEPLGEKLKQIRGTHYITKWNGIIQSMREPERELLAAVLGHRHPAFCGEIQKLALLR
jgi:hypothetical protein